MNIVIPNIMMIKGNSFSLVFCLCDGMGERSVHSRILPVVIDAMAIIVVGTEMLFCGVIMCIG
jgi:hypothetical protein